MARYFWRILAPLMVVCALKAQQPQLSGFIRDQSDAAIAGATVTIRDSAKNFQQSTTSNRDGIYVVLVPPGQYELKVEAAGFSSKVISELRLEVAGKTERNITLAIGNASQEVTVSDNSLGVNTVDATVSTVVDRKFVENMPLNGRSFQSLLTLVPGVSVVPSQGQGYSGELTVNGQRSEANYFVVDGVSANTGAALNTPGWGGGFSGTTPGQTVLGTTQSIASIDALQEFRATTSTYSAEYGRTPGGQFSFTTRSGTNDWHGGLFNYFRNDVLDANNWFNNRAGAPKTAQRQNDFGGTLGAPVVLPHLYNGRDKTFFFLSYEGLRLRTPQPVLSTDVPSLDLRQRAPAILQPFLNAFPLPNRPGAGNGLAEFASGYSTPSALDSTSIRIDHSISDRFRIFGRYSDARSSATARSSTGLSNRTDLAGTVRTLTIGSTNLLTPRLTNELRFNWTRNSQSDFGVLDSFGGATPLTVTDVPGLSGSPDNWFDFYLNYGLNPSFSLTRNRNRQHQINITDSLTATLGRHNLKFGFDYRRLHTLQFFPSLYEFPLYFSQAEVLANAPGYGVLERFPGNINPVYSNFSSFAQDEWKVSSRFNLSLGVRWDVNPAPTDAEGNNPYTVDQIDNLSLTRLAPKDTRLWKTTFWNFAPRIGGAYQLRQTPGRETVLRAGAGLFYDTGNTLASTGYFGVGVVGGARFAGVAFPLSQPSIDALPVGSTAPPYNFTVQAYDPNLRLPRTWQWNVALQQSLGSSQTITASYIGSAGRRLLASQTYAPQRLGNDAFSVGWGLGVVANRAQSDYNSLQLQYQRRLSKGLQVLTSYVWSHSIDNASSNFGVYALLRSSSDFDIRHNAQAAITYEVPGRYRHQLADALLSHWAFDTRITARSSLPVDVFAAPSIDPNTGQSVAIRPNVLPGQPLYVADVNAPGGRRINFDAFGINANSSNGNAGRNVARGFNAVQADVALRRQFTLTERANLQFRAEAFNVLNHPIFGTVFNRLSNGRSRFGYASGTQNSQLGGLNALYQAGGPRSLQLALKFQF